MSQGELNRRNFLKLGLMGSAVLSTVGMTANLTGCSSNTPLDDGFKVLRPEDRAFIRAVAPVMLEGCLPNDIREREQGLNQIVRYIDLGVFASGTHNQKQLTDLFTLLNVGLSRGLTTGVWSKWEDASEADINQFLNRWRNSSIGLFNLAYNGLNKLMSATWYGQPGAWQHADYPGPPYADVLITQSQRN